MAVIFYKSVDLMHMLVACSGDVPIEYCGEDQAICAVGIVTPRPGVFLEAVKHLLVLCTTAEV
jgi:nuclear pore complex protein Nup155